MYSKLPNLILGFHGCDKTVCDKILNRNYLLTASENDYDWLGNGIYFWENNPSRALEYALELKKRGKIKNEAVIGAVIDLGYCLNLLESRYLHVVKYGYEILCKKLEISGRSIPENKFGGSKIDLLLRYLDCAVIEMVHQYNKENKEKDYDSVRGVFIEGNELYPNSGFKEKNHIKICIRNPNCIKGYFRVLETNNDYSLP